MTHLRFVIARLCACACACVRRKKVGFGTCEDSEGESGAHAKYRQIGQ